MAGDHLIFDLDGTISDPGPGILRSINFALSGYGYEEVDARRVAECIGPPIDQVFRDLTRNASQDRILALVARYRARYADVGYSKNELYPGVARAVAELADSERPLGVCTSKRADFAERILDMFGLRDCFRFVAGGEVGVAKGEQLAQLLSDGVVGPGSIMIGDRAIDIHAGHANGLGTVGVLWGYGSDQELVDAGADRILSHPSQLESLATGRSRQ